MDQESKKKNDPPTIMVFRPTFDEFKDFSKYVQYMETQGAMRGGIAKVIPPSNWKARANGYGDIDELVIPAPITQMIDGRGGVYSQINIQRKAIKLKDFRMLAESTTCRTPYHEDYDELDRKYWKNITYNHPMYGADVSGSLYDKDVKEFNINSLNTCLDVIGEDYGIKIEGVNTAYLYFGMWKTTFPWHTEDMDLYSINYLHFGAPKSWFAIPPEHGRRFERVVENYFNEQKQNCSAFLRHKMSILSPQVLRNYSIPYNKVTQEPGEFIITFPYGYHTGYNHGYNCAESTNFALERWIEYGKRCTQCTCRNDCVKINMEVFVKKFQPEKYESWLKGEDIASHPEDPSRVVAAGPLGKMRAIRSGGEKKMVKPTLKRHPHHLKEGKPVAENSNDESETPKPTKTLKPIVKYTKRKLNDDSATVKKVKTEKLIKQRKKITATLQAEINPSTTIEKVSINEMVQSTAVEAKQLAAEVKYSPSVDEVKPSPVSSLPVIKQASQVPTPTVMKVSTPMIAKSLAVENRNSILKHIAPKTETVRLPIKTEAPTSSPSSTFSQCLSQINVPSCVGQIIPSLVSNENNFEYKTIYFQNQPMTVKVMKPSPGPSQNVFPENVNSHQNEYILSTPLEKPKISANAQSNTSSLPPPPIPASPVINAETAAATLLELSQQRHPEKKLQTKKNISNLATAVKTCDDKISKKQNGPVDRPNVKNTTVEQTQNNISPQEKINCDNRTSVKNNDKPKDVASKPSSDKADSERKNLLLNDITSNMKEAWHQVCRHIWQYLPKNLEAEKHYNQWVSLVKPHCAVCMIFKPFLDVISRKDVLPKVPEVSSLEIPISYYELLCGRICSMDYDGPRTLLACSDCGICVHDCCYGASLPSANWKCDRCSSQIPTSDCCACNLRGGALKPTTDGKWIHVLCALILPDIEFKNNSLLVECNIISRRKSLKCIFCGNKSLNRNAESACAQCSKGKCAQSYHITCGYVAGVNFKLNEWPSLIESFCLKHSEVKPKLLERKMLPISEGTEVFAKHRNSRYYLSEIISITTQTFYSVVFDDGTQSEDLYPEDIVSHDCLKYGPPEMNAHVSIKWTDGSTYEGIFIDSSSCVMCHIQFEDGSLAKVKRENVYVKGEQMPKKVSSRLSTATEGKHTDLFDGKRQAEGKRIRHANTKYLSEESVTSHL